MPSVADGINRTLNSVGSWLNSHYWDVAGPLATAAVVGAVTVIWNRYFGRRRFGWNLVWDERINQDDPSGRRAPARNVDTLFRQRMWEIVYRPAEVGADAAGGPPSGAWDVMQAGVPTAETGGQPAVTEGTGAPQTATQETTPYPVRDGSLVVMHLRNTGRKPIVEADFGEQRNFTMRFPGRRVVHYKIRENDRYHDLVQRTAQPVIPGAGNSFDLPALLMNPGDSFKLLVLLEGNIPPGTPPKERVKILGSIVGGKFTMFDDKPHRWRWAVPLALVVAVAGLFTGLRLGAGSQAPAPVCGSGPLTIVGSTAFAPIINQVATEYVQYCPDARISVNAVGSVQGLKNLEAASAAAGASASGVQMIAMYDGSPTGPLGPQYVVQPVGDIIYAVVGNRSLPSNVFAEGTLGGLKKAQIAAAFNDPSAGHYAPVGRSSASGTRQTFANRLLSHDDRAEDRAPACPSSGGTAGAVCLVGTTMELLTDVNTTPDAIGYAEADALPFFPNVGAIPVNGFAPTRANALDGNYPFLTTEHLYTIGVPSGLAADLISFLQSGPVTAQLRATSSFIACGDLAGAPLARTDGC